MFNDQNIQNNLKKLVLLQNPKLDNSIFHKRRIQKLKSLEHLELGGKPNFYCHGIDYDGGLIFFASQGTGSPPNDWPEKKLQLHARGLLDEDAYEEQQAGQMSMLASESMSKFYYDNNGRRVKIKQENTDGKTNVPVSDRVIENLSIIEDGNKLPIRVLKFEYCSKIGDIAI